jgi:ribosomal 50S subunit-recycling heat shock protein
MRVDRFLKLTRIVKRRTLAKELCDEGVVLVNGTTARAGREVKVGDRLLLLLRNRHLEIEVEEVPDRPPSTSKARELYRVVQDERMSDNESENEAADTARTRTWTDWDD